TANGKKQSIIKFQPRDDSPEELFAVAVYTSTANFSIFDTPEWSEFFASISFKPPGCKAFSERFLSAIYARTLQLVMEVALAAKYIQIVIDGSGNISKERVEKVCFLVNNISYYWSTKAVGAIRATTEWTISNLFKKQKQ
ncbi:hypothetical protein GcC1_151011, partial [Golovinomyces cichoracearum]